MMQQQCNRRDQTFVDDKTMAAMTGLPVYWFRAAEARKRLGIPFYLVGSDKVLRFSIEDVFHWEVHHLRPCRPDVGVVADAP
ncbi:MAG: hypothetical protein IT514_07770 [Burkholderiales bacterium]|nr:hypothetical protein [Burkholderiales bacterium]